MPSLPAPPAPLLLLGLLLLGSRPARGAGPEHPALPIRPEKEPLPVRGAAGRRAPRGRRGRGVRLGASLRPPGGGAGRRWLGAAGGPEGCPGTRGPARSAPGRAHGRSGTAAASQARPRRLLLRREGLCLGRDPQWGRRARGAGRVSCKNIKPECPTLACGQPRQLPGHCCQTCPQGKAGSAERGGRQGRDAWLGGMERSTGPLLAHPKPVSPTLGAEHSSSEKQPTGLAFEYPRDPEHRSYSDRGEPGAEDRGRGDGHTDFVALLTGPRSQAVARARVSLQRSSLRFSISYRRLDRPTRIRFSDSTGSILFEHPAAPTQDGLVCGVWRAVPRLSLRLLRAEQLYVALVTPTHPSGEVWGPLIRHRALAAETFSAILTLEGPPQPGIGGIALLTLSDTEDSLHFLLLFRGLLESRSGGKRDGGRHVKRVGRAPIFQRFHVCGYCRTSPGSPVAPDSTPGEATSRAPSQCLSPASCCAHRTLLCPQEPGFAEVLPNLTAQEMDWLVLGELQMALERASGPGLRISGHIAARQSCDVLQSVLCGADALIPVQTGAAGSASLTLLGNGSLIYQVQVVGTGSEVVAMTLETKPQRRNQHTVLCHMVGLQPGGHRAVGICPGLGARGAHMLLQNELFLNVGTKDFPDGELRGHVAALPYRLGGSEQGTITAHLLGPPGMPGPRRLLKGFYGPEAQGVVKDLEPELLRHLAQGSASLLITTKGSPQGELRGQVHIANQCEVGGLRLAAAGDKEVQVPGALEAVAAMVAPLPAVPGPDTSAPARPGGPGRLRDPNTCFFEGQQRPHGAHWAPNYDPLCSLCTCQVGGPGRVHWGLGSGAPEPTLNLSLQRRTVICDPVVCPPPSCPSPVQAPDQCCPVCPGNELSTNGAGHCLPPGCYFDGDRSWRAAGTRWHPVVPPFGLIKCAVCTCKGGTGEVHCEKVQCPRLACAQPVRANPTDCCKQCPGAHPQLGDPMQADGPRGCRFAGQWFPESQSWHPSVPPFGEMSCHCAPAPLGTLRIWSVLHQAGVPHCERDDCSPPLSCGPGKESRCCSHCTPQR
ncbi:hypothetical protein MG293_000539, partial [Ovis ammon polii]